MNLRTLLDSPQNGFNTVRLLAALSVVVTHAYLLVFGVYAAVPLSWGPYDLGAIAVDVFFFISGLMLSRSFELNPDWRRFAVARVLRIFPALLVAGMLVAWVLAPFFTARPLTDYFLDPRTLLYPLTSTFELGVLRPSGVFPASTQPGEIDLPLWTVKYELLAYFAFGVASATGVFRSARGAVLLCIAFGIALTATRAMGVLGHSPLGSVIRFGFCFLLGVSAYRYRGAVTMRWWAGLALAVAALALSATIAGPVAWILASCYAALIVASIDVPGLTAFTRKTDLSFGIYVYAWPLQQVLMTADWARGNVWLHIAVACVVTAAIGWMSWTFVEKPALGLKRRLPAAPRPVVAAARTD